VAQDVLVGSANRTHGKYVGTKAVHFKPLGVA